MPDSNFPKVTMAEEDLRSMFNRGGRDLPPGRKWSCPGEEMIAAYADGALRNIRKTWVEFHLAGCQRCRLLVAGVIKARREVDLPLPPEEVRWNAIGAEGRRSPPRRWIWVPVGALAVLALLAVATIFLRKPDLLIVRSPSPSVPLVAKSEPTAPLRAPVRDIERTSRSTDLVPSVLLPQADSVIRRERLHFGWNAVPHSRYYEVRLVTSDGDLVWEGQTEKPELQPPSDLVVRDGSYFVWITAYLADGRTAKSSPVKFGVKR